MALEDQEKRDLEAIVRGLSAAAKSLRLYPPTSPIPKQSVDAAAEALVAFLGGRPVLSLAVGRDGLTYTDEPIASGTPGVGDLAGDLRAHGVAEVDFLPGCSPDDLMRFLTLAMGDAAATRTEGGFAAQLVSLGVESIRASDVHLTVVEEDLLTPDTDIDAFFRDLGMDPAKLTAWLTAMSKKDSSALEDGLAELGRAAGDDGLVDLARNLAAAFAAQDAGGKDALFAVAMDAGDPREIVARAFAFVSPDQMAGGLTGGLYGRNMLSLSNAMTKLPIAEQLDSIMAEVRAMLPDMGRSGKESEFLEHMMTVRAKTEPEVPIAVADQTYATVAKLTEVTEEERTRASGEASSAKASARAVETMLALLDQQTDYGLYCHSIESLAGMVPVLVEERDLAMALHVLGELHSREMRAQQPWPDLDRKLRDAISSATGRRTMAAVLKALAEDPSRIALAREIVKQAGEGSDVALAEEALALKAEGLSAAEDLVGRRIVDLLAAAAPNAQWFQLAPIVARLAREPDARAVGAIHALMNRADEQSRREVASGLAMTGGFNAARELGTLSKDASAEVAVIAVRALGKMDGEPAARVLSERLGELDIDGKDFALAREVIGALARVSDPSAEAALKSLAARKALIKRGHFAEVQDLVKQALDYRTRQGGAK
ncbi:MAG: hypothetical protein FDZ70_05585 [Actinobacteria bacterium]|nr:MAG: hypothetical protein FDZ70_05585 [Actinomycetota bacterium]